MAAVTSLFFPNRPKISRRRKRQVNERGRERAIVQQSANSRAVVIFPSSTAIRGANLETILYLCALSYLCAENLENVHHKKRSRLGKPSSSSLFIILSKKTNTTRKKTKKEIYQKKIWRSTRRPGERATSSSRPLCSVSAEACITTRWRKGGKN